MNVQLLLALLAVAAVLTSCTSRTILHGMRSLAPQPRATAADNQILVWFVKPAGQGPQTVAVRRHWLGTGDRLEQAVKELLSGPSASEEKRGLGSEIPRGTLLLGISRRGRLAELNLSRRFALDGGTTSFETRLDQLRKTVSPVCGAADVYLSIEGKRLLREEGEGIEIRQPINR